MTDLLDKKGRILLKWDFDGNILFGRYKDMSEEDKQFLLDICEDMSNVNKEELRKFLDFETEEFCS